MGSDSLSKDVSRKMRKRQMYAAVVAGVALVLFGAWTFITHDDQRPDLDLMRQDNKSATIDSLELVEKELNELQVLVARLRKEHNSLQRQLHSSQRAQAENVRAKDSALASAETAEGWVKRGKGSRFAIITAFEGKQYEIMGALASDTKAKYAALHNYAYFLDNDLLTKTMSFQRKSGSRIAAFQRHWNDYEWLLWTDADVLITNPDTTLDSLVETYAPEGSDVHVLMSKDWGGRQVNPGVTLLRTSEQGKQFLDRWAAEIEIARHNDDLLAIKEGMEPKKAEELKYVHFVRQNVLNSYPNDTLKFEKYNSTTIEHNKSHDFWEPGQMFVHIVNCLRQSPNGIDEPCCNGLAARYWHEFMKRLEVRLDGVSSDESQDREALQTATMRDWTCRFRSNLLITKA